MAGFVERLLSFDKMMAGTIVKVLYYIGLAGIVIWGVWNFFGNLFSGNFGTALFGLIMLPISILILRVICEMYIVLFRISDNLAKLRKLKEGETNEISST